ncbi:dihydropteroate synthase [Myceligenerans pegani]|uniref:Dihydropteroate synthase n=1 Tax=Myceligenerans pegani TaxID=2776917 RepID=A0ABR9N252_9MICO|nr:dihydropteroate synthase [Myceligenerans sp. TRM 65318]MBE1877087.1 dihydropteroate synthase [Myceligenerans sp. TRM 65318]MBE3019358.1 dihydropteroate synthase [Myceligenerans sp. TRM 65318]
MSRTGERPATAGIPAGSPPLVLRGRELGRTGGAARPVVMAVVNRTTDSFFARARLPDDDAALRAAEQALAHGAEILDVGGVRAGVGPAVDEAEEIARVVPLVARVRRELPELLVSVDTWRAGVARAAVDAGADLINDTWAGHDPALVEVAGAAGVGVVCSHTGGATPRTDPYRVEYPSGTGLDDPRDAVLDDVLATLRAAAERAVSAGVPPSSVVVDPTHDFGKNTWHSLHLLRRTAALADLHFPLLMALSRKDFVGETLDLPPDERLEGTLAATAVAAWLGARVFRVHDVRATRRVLDMVAALRDEAPPAAALRGLG